MIYYSIIPESLTTADFEKIYSDISPLLPDFRQKKAEGIIPARERAVSALSFVLLCPFKGVFRMFHFLRGL